MDVSTAITVIINSLQVHKVPLEAYGPIESGLSALLLGTSSATLQSIFVHLGVINADYTGQICAMMSMPSPLVTIPAKTRITHLVPFRPCLPKTDPRTRGD